MPVRSIASLSLSFGLVAIPVKLYSATESSAAIKFKLMSPTGARLRQQFVADEPPLVRGLPIPAGAPAGKASWDDAESAERVPPARGKIAASKVVDLAASRTVRTSPPPALELPHEDPAPGDPVVERSAMMKGYEYQKGKFVLFTPEELRSLESGSRKTIDIISFLPQNAVDPIFYDKAYFLAPDKRGNKPYSLLRRAMQEMDRCALARWAFRSKEYVVTIRPAGDGLVLQQLFYASEVRSIDDLHIEPVDVADAELALAKQLMTQISVDAYRPSEFMDEEKQRILKAVEEKIAGRSITSVAPAASGGTVINLLEALRASLAGDRSGNAGAPPGPSPAAERRPAKRAPTRPVEVTRRAAKKRSVKR